MYDLLIIGQGLAGTMLAHFALERGLSICIIDSFNPNSASNVASGVANPITGRKMVKTWMADTLFPYAKSTYRAIEQKFDIQFLEETPIKKIFSSDDDVHAWHKHSNNIEYKNYIGTIANFDNNCINAKFGAGEIQQTFWLNTKVLIEHYRKLFLDKGILFSDAFDYSLLNIGEKIQYKDIVASKIVFCEGYKVIENPFFNFIPIKTAKGEQLKIHIEKLHTKYIVNKNIFIIPTNNNNYHVGSTYIWNDLDEQVTELGRKEIIDKLERLISCNYEILEEKAGIRPTIKDRRPALGKHKIHKNLFVFNGLGTKGITLSPYFSNHLLSHIFDGEELLAEVDVKRFYK
ncbi:MAG: FAD-dependent oxidoreductase [Sphingobacteriales bacterium]|jgi:glycine/D-amino acid oxidase-like deaminating enzyme|nr:MAG: FAD-dependent oxidoreductase [Sphingobacteriales bacterium]